MPSMTQPDSSWTQQIPPEQWQVYLKVIEQLRRRRIQFALGGAFALAAYTGRWRNTKDLDFYLMPEDREAGIDAVHQAGLADYHDHMPYDREWIYRSHQGEVIVDLIWSFANQPTVVDSLFVSAGPVMDMHGESLRIVPAEEMIWAKIYILQKDRCDWGDVLNLLYFQGETLDWLHLLQRVDQDIPLLRGALSVYAWLVPGRARSIPDWVWERVGIAELPGPVGEETTAWRVRALDSRPWFGEAS